jgi:hypothetical protein
MSKIFLKISKYDNSQKTFERVSRSSVRADSTQTDVRKLIGMGILLPLLPPSPAAATPPPPPV